MRRAKAIRKSQLQAVEHHYAEAYHLMTYQCQECQHVELIWNSRDGVTPFSIPCTRCGKPEMVHIHWQSDAVVSNREMRDGDFYFAGKPDHPKLRLFMGKKP